MKIRILQSAASTGARDLARALREDGLDALRTKVRGSSYQGSPSHLIVNWGRASYPPGWSGAPVLNKPESVVLASNKVKTFKKLVEAGMIGVLPRWTVLKSEAEEFLSDGEIVYCRTLARGSQGRGIIIAHEIDELVSAPLYTAKIDTYRELRLHVFKGTVIDFAQKRKMGSERLEEEGIDEPDEEIRSHGRGWVFARSGVEVADRTKEVAVKAVNALGLDFGAVDLQIDTSGRERILEINTAPGLEGQTLESYKQAIKSCIASS